MQRGDEVGQWEMEVVWGKEGIERGDGEEQ